MITPRHSFSRAEGLFLRAVLVGTGVLFVALLVLTWVLSERARPVLLDLK